MESIKPLYLMAGGRGGKASNALLKAIFRDIAKAKPVIAYVGAANNDDLLFFRFMSPMLKKGGDCDLQQVKLCSKRADIGKAKNQLENCDAVFMAGGDVEAGMQILAERGLLTFFKELYQAGKLLFGASAGSIMLADNWVRWSDPDDDETAELFPCLGIAPVLCDTHAEETEWDELQWAVKRDKEGITGHGIPTNGCLKVDPDGRLSALDRPVARYQKRDGQAVRIADLLPESEG
jgi:peptidase E